jgi:hypothetical protein
VAVLLDGMIALMPSCWLPLAFVAAGKSVDDMYPMKCGSRDETGDPDMQLRRIIMGMNAAVHSMSRAPPVTPLLTFLPHMKLDTIELRPRHRHHSTTITN